MIQTNDTLDPDEDRLQPMNLNVVSDEFLSQVRDTASPWIQNDRLPVTETVNNQRLIPRVTSRTGSPVPKSSTIWMYSFIFVILWYSFSGLLSIYNKSLLGRDHYGFAFPLLASFFHAAVQWIMSNLFLHSCMYHLLEPYERAGDQNPFTMRHVFPCALATALDIGLSNASLRSVSLAFYTMIKSCSPIFVFFFSIFFGIQEFRWTVCGSILLMSLGVVLTALGDVSFDALGFVMVLSASVFSGLRWSLTQLLLVSKISNRKHHHPLIALYYLTPFMSVLLIALSLLLENWSLLHSSPFFLSSAAWLRLSQGSNSTIHFEPENESILLGLTDGHIRGIGLLALGGLIAFAMILAEFSLLTLASVLSVSVLGVLKEMMTITLSVLVFGDSLTVTTGLGLLVSVTGIYMYHRDASLHSLHQKQSKQAEEYIALEEQLQQMDQETKENIPASPTPSGSISLPGSPNVNQTILPTPRRNLNPQNLSVTTTASTNAAAAARAVRRQHKHPT